MLLSPSVVLPLLSLRGIILALDISSVTRCLLWDRVRQRTNPRRVPARALPRDYYHIRLQSQISEDAGGISRHVLGNLTYT